MKKTLSFISFGIAMSIFSSLTTKPTVYAQSLSASPFIAESDITLTAPYFLYIQSMILSILVDTFSSRISLTMPPSPKPHNTACVLS